MNQPQNIKLPNCRSGCEKSHWTANCVFLPEYECNVSNWVHSVLKITLTLFFLIETSTSDNFLISVVKASQKNVV